MDDILEKIIGALLILIGVLWFPFSFNNFQERKNNNFKWESLVRDIGVGILIILAGAGLLFGLKEF